jgi:hypothetical protein
VYENIDEEDSFTPVKRNNLSFGTAAIANMSVSPTPDMTFIQPVNITAA